MGADDQRERTMEFGKCLLLLLGPPEALTVWVLDLEAEPGAAGTLDEKIARFIEQKHDEVERAKTLDNMRFVLVSSLRVFRCGHTDPEAPGSAR